MITQPMPSGTRCAECGAEVERKVVIRGEQTPPFPGAACYAVEPDRLGANLPCGHDALAVWRGP